jgi:hypothetical protein
MRDVDIRREFIFGIANEEGTAQKVAARENPRRVRSALCEQRLFIVTASR